MYVCCNFSQKLALNTDSSLLGYDAVIIGKDL
jgi:hypothetical protein